MVYSLAEELYGRHGRSMPAFQLRGTQGADLLDSALAVVAAPYYNSVPAAVAAMFNSLVDNHPFGDGNKRFAVVATQVTLMINGHVALLSDEEWAEVALSIAANTVTVSDLAAFFDSRIFDMLAMPQDGTMVALWHDTIGVDAVENLLAIGEVLLERRADFEESIRGVEG